MCFLNIVTKSKWLTGGNMGVNGCPDCFGTITLLFLKCT